MKLHTCLTSTLDGGRSGHFTSGEISLGTYWTEAWISPGAGLDVVAQRKIPVPAGNITPVIQPVVVVI